MSDQALAKQARGLGLKTRWQDAQGKTRVVSPDSLRRLVPLLQASAHDGKGVALPPMIVAQSGRAVRLPAGAHESDRYKITLEDGMTMEGRVRKDRQGTYSLAGMRTQGYHKLEIGDREVTLAVAPSHCPTLADLTGARTPRMWGGGAQVYGLRDRNDGGLGHFSAVGGLASALGHAGGDALMLSPTHAMFAARPEHYSPYSPSSRLFLNVFLIDPHAVFDAQTVRAAMRRAGLSVPALHRLEEADLINWTEAASARLKLLRALYETRSTPVEPDDFAAFVAAGGTPLHQHAVFEVLHAQAVRRGPRGGDWRSWQETVRHPGNPEVASFARGMEDEVMFHKFLQWLAARGLRSAQESALKGGMRIGLIGDLAIGVDPQGSECWSNQTDHLLGLSIGAPPDALSRAGQNWGLTTYAPRRLVATGYRALIEMLKANFRYVGGLRMDHVMGMERLWVIPEGGSSADGAYLDYPRDDILHLTALEAARAGAVVIGEDLGTVEPTFREALSRQALLGMNVLPFQKDPKGCFLAPDAWSGKAVAMTTTHDLPPLAGWWQGVDLQWRRTTREIATDEGLESARKERDGEREALWSALSADRRKKKRPVRKAAPDQAKAPDECTLEDPTRPDASAKGARVIVDLAVRYTAEAACPLALVPLEDLLGLDEAVNIPGTLTEHPNWRRRYPGLTRMLLKRAAVTSRLTGLRTERPR
ncbi:4-alpha-glucanotransferase [Brytella acorum]|uniref:4-alpha-glucanotransferase n=1 Tax=Brytella acorum TaxID=2959299 RepID=A0AA35XX64_9PROT|nr:4-alpha-glucanotransferase [Brytella acorum]MDF3625859.1 4-alpha-glucanotransferase [Brytella acorum]CAI9121587.1 4-alpha-glucanotransferase [Brytella acorum]